MQFCYKCYKKLFVYVLYSQILIKYIALHILYNINIVITTMLSTYQNVASSRHYAEVQDGSKNQTDNNQKTEDRKYRLQPNTCNTVPKITRRMWPGWRRRRLYKLRWAETLPCMVPCQRPLVTYGRWLFNGSLQIIRYFCRFIRYFRKCLQLDLFQVSQNLQN